MIQAGKLRDFVTVLAPTDVADSTGQRDTVFKVFSEAWAEITPLGGRELINAQMLQSTISVRVRMRYLQGVTPNMRIAFEGRTLNIKTVIDPDRRRRELELLCTEVQ